MCVCVFHSIFGSSLRSKSVLFANTVWGGGLPLRVSSFKCLGAALCMDGTSSAEIRIKIDTATSAIASLKRIRRSNTINFSRNFKSYKSLVTSILLHGCEILLGSAKRGHGFQYHVPEETILHLLPGAEDEHFGVEQDQLPCGSTGNSSGNCQETETPMLWACHTPRQPLQTHPSGHLGGLATPWSAEKTPAGQRQRLDVLAHAKTAHAGLPQRVWKRISAESSLVLLSLPPPPTHLR